MRIVGHSQQREELERAGFLSPVLLWGPSGIGKWLIAGSWADEQGGAAITLRDGPTAEQARQMVSLFRQVPIGGRSASLVALIDLDECSEAVQNVLLKTLEEAPEWAKIVLVASGKVMPTIRSRCTVIEFPPLRESEVSEVLVGLGHSPAEAASMAVMSGGSVERARVFSEAVRQKPLVVQYLEALSRVDRVALSTLIPRWDEAASTLLWRWVSEVLSDWPRVFTKSELGLVHKIGVQNFYKLVELIKQRMEVDVVAMEIWKR